MLTLFIGSPLFVAQLSFSSATSTTNIQQKKTTYPSHSPRSLWPVSLLCTRRKKKFSAQTSARSESQPGGRPRQVLPSGPPDQSPSFFCVCFPLLSSLQPRGRLYSLTDMHTLAVDAVRLYIFGIRSTSSLQHAHMFTRSSSTWTGERGTVSTRTSCFVTSCTARSSIQPPASSKHGTFLAGNTVSTPSPSHMPPTAAASTTRSATAVRSTTKRSCRFVLRQRALARKSQRLSAG